MKIKKKIKYFKTMMRLFLVEQVLNLKDKTIYIIYYDLCLIYLLSFLENIQSFLLLSCSSITI